jgi:hypothetical protein
MDFVNLHYSDSKVHFHCQATSWGGVKASKALCPSTPDDGEVMSPVKYELGSHSPQDDILHNHRHEVLKFYIALTGCAL